MRRWFVLLATAALYLAACKGIRIHVAESSSTTVEKGTLLEDLVGDFGFGDFLNMDLTESQELQNQGVEPGDIDSVYMTSLELRVVSPQGGDLSFLEDLAVYVEAPGVERRLLAWQDEFPAGQGTVALELEDLDLTAYVVSESMSIVTDVTGRRPDQDTKVEASFELELLAKAAAACNSRE